MPHFEFERWIVEKFGGTPNIKQTADGGSDGEKNGAPLQVKRWKNKVGRPEIQKFQSVCRAGRKFRQLQETAQPVGYFIAFEFAKEAMEELARLKNSDNVLIKSVLVSDIVPLARKPSVRIDWQVLADGCYEFVASSDSPVINFTWDFAYSIPAHKHPEQACELQPSVMYDKTGRQVRNIASNGQHNIAVKVVDEKYLENVAVCSINVG